MRWPSFGNILHGEQDQFRFIVASNNPARVEPHELVTNTREIVLDFVISKTGVLGGKSLRVASATWGCSIVRWIFAASEQKQRNTSVGKRWPGRRID